MSTIVIGIGNLLMTDEGVGVHVARWLTDHRVLPEEVDVLDGGTGGFHLMGHFQNYDRVILVDATADGQNPGTITQLQPRYASDYPQTLTAHDIGLKDLIEAMYLLDSKPEIILFTISIRMPVDFGVELSADVAACVPRVAEAVRTYLAAGG
ncbi:MAG: HyaD/HybD family hydrogenase maturation endopeptidase [Rhodothermales bacterium]|nr:HyaD/HybD family hydrogenase maturation endopeptidase [Rhodothermales bacterium]